MANPSSGDEDPLGIYQKILASKICFPVFMSEGAKALVKKPLTAELITAQIT